MARLQFILLILVLVTSSAAFAIWLRRRQARPEQPNEPLRRLPADALRGLGPLAAAQRLCEVGAGALGAHLAIFGREDDGLSLVASAPRRPHLEILDKVAAEWALAHCVPTGRGTGLMAAADWQFQPVFRHGRLFGLLAIAGQGGREPVRYGQEWLLEDVLRQAGTVLDALPAAPQPPYERPLLFT